MASALLHSVVIGDGQVVDNLAGHNHTKKQAAISYCFLLQFKGRDSLESRPFFMIAARLRIWCAN